MSRSLKKAPFIEEKLYERVCQMNEKGEKKGYKHRERFSGSASRSYYVGDIDEKKVTATFENGALKVFFPKEKEPEVTSHQIAIK